MGKRINDEKTLMRRGASEKLKKAYCSCSGSAVEAHRYTESNTKIGKIVVGI
ncbi:hypothetical protein ALO84_200143 [Pseudomonas syringae pv. maculicola]|nr:hypothetical protein ALO84_200143 [Pseudomonas syringae pv. maculicola]